MRYGDRSGPPPCPESFPSKWREVWEEVVNSVAPDHWRHGDGPLVESFVTTLARLRSVQHVLAEHGEVDENGGRTQASRIAESCAKVLQATAPKLRMAPSARHDARQASRSTSGVMAADAFLESLDAMGDAETFKGWGNGGG